MDQLAPGDSRDSLRPQQGRQPASAARSACLRWEPGQEAVRQIDNLCRQIGSIDVRWKTVSLPSGIEILRKHHPEMAIIGLGRGTAPALASLSAMARGLPGLYLM